MTTACSSSSSAQASSSSSSSSSGTSSSLSLSCPTRLLERNATVKRIRSSSLKNREICGLGHFAVVYRAQVLSRRVHTDSARRFVAIKFARDKADELDIWKEVEILVRLKHPNIIRVLGVTYDSKGRRGAVLTFAPWSLVDVYTYVDPVRIALGVAKAMAYLHLHDFLHMDLKPGNVLVTKAGKALLSDFGLSGEVSQSVYLRGAGTVGFMAPEVADRGGPIFSFPADVYSFGILLQKLSEHCNNVPDALDELAVACVHVTPSRRPSFREICRLLKRLPLSRSNLLADLPSSGMSCSYSDEPEPTTRPPQAGPPMPFGPYHGMRGERAAAEIVMTQTAPSRYSSESISSSLEASTSRTRATPSKKVAPRSPAGAQAASPQRLNSAKRAPGSAQYTLAGGARAQGYATRYSSAASDIGLVQSPNSPAGFGYSIFGYGQTMPYWSPGMRAAQQRHQVVSGPYQASPTCSPSASAVTRTRATPRTAASTTAVTATTAATERSSSSDLDYTLVASDAEFTGIPTATTQQRRPAARRPRSSTDEHGSTYYSSESQTAQAALAGQHPPHSHPIHQQHGHARTTGHAGISNASPNKRKRCVVS